MISRREFLGISLGAGTTLALTPQLLRALQQPGGQLIQRPIPSSGEMLPVVGLTLANHAACADPAALKEVVKTFVDNGGSVFDAMQQSLPAAEQATFAIVTELGLQKKLFFSWPGTPPGPPQPGGAALVKTHVETVLANLRVPKLDLVMVGRGDPTQLAALKAMKAQGLVRYIGVQTGASAAYAALEPIMRNEPIDFIGLHYAIDRRGPEETILPLAQERKIGVMAYLPFGGAGGASCTGGRGLFARVATTPLPEWSAEFDAKTWAQFFLKYVLSHPAVTVARVGTTKATHMLDNIGGGIGRLPNEATRTRMAALADSWPQAGR
jgi:aryl-alcohol dehydrogenase-like predicted oxidoreductase